MDASATPKTARGEATRRAILTAACKVKKEGVNVIPEIMIPLALSKTELDILKVDCLKVAEEFIKPVVGGKELVAISQMVFPKLPGDISLWFQQLRNGWLIILYSLLGAGHANSQ